MPFTEEAIQQTVLSLEAGPLARTVRRAAVAVAVLLLCWFYLVHEFRGLSMAQGMDQAQIGREIARGHGFATEFARPLAMGDLKRNGKEVKTAAWLDTYNAPLPPLLDAAALYFPVKGGWQMTRKDVVYAGDRLIATVQVLCFLGSIVVLYLLAKELFDKRLAYMACGLVLGCDMMWEYSLSGLPQMWLLLLFNATLYTLARAMRARYAGDRTAGWLAGAGLGFGLLALSHAITIWIFVPALVFCGGVFRPRFWGAGIMLAAFLAVYSPWLVRNAYVCGDARGLGIYAVLDGIQHSEAGHMRRLEVDLKDVTVDYYGQNFRLNVSGQINRLVEYFGWSCVAPLAFVSLLHAFKRPLTAAFRWLATFMWLGAVAGMGVFGMKEYHALAANQLHLLFVPIFTCYGLAYVLVHWDRRIGLGGSPGVEGKPERAHSLLRGSVVVLVFFLCCLPLLGRICFSRSVWQVQWPPYLPPYISMVRDWMAPNEIVASDMPWAVAWYADRKSLWVPETPDELYQINDYKELGGPAPTIYLTPISGTENPLADLVSGEYKPWAAFIVRTIDLKTTPYQWSTVLGQTECVFYADRDRSHDQSPGLQK